MKGRRKGWVIDQRVKTKVGGKEIEEKESEKERKKADGRTKRKDERNPEMNERER